MTRLRSGFCLASVFSWRSPVSRAVRLSAAAPRHGRGPHDRAAADRTARRRRRVAANAVAVRLLDTQARAHIGRRVLHQQPDGELTEDPVWRWSSAPDRYLDTALRLELAAARDVRLVDSGTASTLAVTLLVWHLESRRRDAAGRGDRAPVRGSRPGGQCRRGS